jgi:hypothetical protein
MDPDRPAMQKVLHLSSQRFDEMAGAFTVKANEINDHVWVQGNNPRAEGEGLFLFIAVRVDFLNQCPGGVALIRLALPAADRDDLVARRHKARNEIGSNMSGASDDDDTHLGNFECRSANVEC